MKRILLNTEQSEEKRIIVVEDGLVTEYETELGGNIPHKGNIYKATVERIEPSLEAAFIDLPDDRNGFLPFKEIAPEYLKPENGKQSVGDRLAAGDSILVQIVKERRDNKGAVLTTYINLQGCYLVLMPNQKNGNQISKMADREVRSELQGMLGELTAGRDISLLLRTVGLDCDLEDLKWDLDSYLLKLWTLIKSTYEKQKGNVLIYSEHNLIMKTRSEYFRKDVDELLCDTASTYNEMKALFDLMMPEYTERIKMHELDTPMVSKEIEQQIRAVHSRTIALPSGGQIAFDSTEALVAIDVNSSRSTKGANIEETALQTNLEAANEVARQLKLRDLSGLVVVDFIDMDTRGSREKVQQAFRRELKKDRARVRTTDISGLGLMELSRQRIRPALDATYRTSCPHCAGTGNVPTVQSAALELLRQIREKCTHQDSGAIIANCSLDLATYMLNEKRIEIRRIEDMYYVSVIVLPNDKLPLSNYQVEALNKTRKRDAEILKKLSYEIQQDPQEKVLQDYLANSPETPPPARPIIEKVVPEKPVAEQQKSDGKNSEGILKRIFDLFESSFSSGKEEGKGGNGSERSKEKRAGKSSSGAEKEKRKSRGGRKPKNGDEQTDKQKSNVRVAKEDKDVGAGTEGKKRRRRRHKKDEHPVSATPDTSRSKFDKDSLGNSTMEQDDTGAEAFKPEVQTFGKASVGSASKQQDDVRTRDEFRDTSPEKAYRGTPATKGSRAEKNDADKAKPEKAVEHADLHKTAMEKKDQPPAQHDEQAKDEPKPYNSPVRVPSSSYVQVETKSPAQDQSGRHSSTGRASDL